jgi:hypothetical protein
LTGAVLHPSARRHAQEGLEREIDMDEFLSLSMVTLSMNVTKPP